MEQKPDCNGVDVSEEMESNVGIFLKFSCEGQGVDGAVA